MAGDVGMVPYPAQLLDRARQDPSSIALVFQEYEVPAGVLADRALAVVHALQAATEPGARVAICCEKGVEWVVACYACSLGGYPFTVVDKRLTPQQRQHIWNTWAPTAVLGIPNTFIMSLVPEALQDHLPVVDLAEPWGDVDTDAVARTLPTLTLDTGVYVDWTSGTSSGKPKGVVCRHRHLLHMWQFRLDNYPMAPGERVGVNMFPLWYWWMGIALGHTSVLIPDTVMVDTNELVPYLARWGVTRIDCMTASLLRVWMQDSRIGALREKMRLFIVSGEPLPLVTVRMVHEKLPATAVLNMLSTTEAGDVCFMELSKPVTDSLLADGIEYAPVGIPLPSVDLRLEPYEDSGKLELLVAGTGVPPDAAYLGDDMADAFRVHPPAGGVQTWFTKDCVTRLDVPMLIPAGHDATAMAADHFGLVGPCFQRLCRADDAGQWSMHGIYDLRGRLNNTAKVRGFRIDLSAIQSALRKVTLEPRATHTGMLRPKIVDSTAVVQNDTLVAFIALRFENAIPSTVDYPSATELHREIRMFLDEHSDLAKSHMPSAYRFVRQLPLTNTGKINEITLARWGDEGIPDEAQVTEIHAGLRSEEDRHNTRQPEQLRRVLAEGRDAMSRAVALVRGAWADLFGSDAVSPIGEDVSMWDLGAHSLMLTRLGRVLNIKVVDLFELETIAQQAAKVAALAADALADDATPAHKSPAVRLSSDLAAHAANTPVAIIGIGVRWPCPGGDNLAAVHASLSAPTALDVEFADAVLVAKGVPERMLRDPHYVRRGVLLDTEYVEAFDCESWGMTRGEVLAMDPNSRALLEVCYEALLDSGYAYGIGKDHDAARPVPTRNVGVFAAGPSLPQYLTDVLGEDTLHARAEDPSRYWALEVGNDKDYCATRVAYALDLHGPAQTVQTACSSGLSAVAAAAQALRAHTCDVALAAAASIPLPQDTGYLHQPGMVWAADGRCRPFDTKAGGTAPGAAVVAFTLKPLAAAEADGDRIYATLLGVGVSNDGARKHTFHAPSKSGQVTALRRALRDADVAPEDVSMVEAHGTGTQLGDPLEIAALVEAYGFDDADAAAAAGAGVHLGSVKGHIGHANTAAGAAGLLKAVLALHTGTVYPTANHTTPMAALRNTPFTVPTAAVEWAGRGDGKRRVCGVSSFGVGGTNVHLICEAHASSPAGRGSTAAAAAGDKHSPVVLVASGRTERAAKQAAERLQRLLLREDATAMEVHAAEAALLRRPVYRYRCTVSRAAGVARVADSRAVSHGAGGVDVALCFPGQGGFTAGLGTGLRGCASLPLFRETIDAIEAHLGAPVLAPPPTTNRGEQLLQFSVGYAVAKALVGHFGIRPVALVGHSLGEIVAATVAGVFSLADALTFVAARGSIMDGLERKGSMMSVLAPRADVEAYLAAHAGALPSVEVACLNAHDRVVLAGDADDLQRVKDANEAWSCVMLRVAAGFHSRAVEPGLPELRRTLETIAINAPTTPIASTLTGSFLSNDSVPTAQYWVDHMRRPVQFASAVGAVREAHPSVVFVECGPQLLTGCIRAITGTARACALMSKPGKASPEEEPGLLWAGVGELWQHGASVNWARAFTAKHAATQCAPQPVWGLPPPGFARERVWPVAPAYARAATGSAAGGGTTPATDARLLERYERRSTAVAPGDAQLMRYTYTGVAVPACAAGDGAGEKQWPVLSLDGGFPRGPGLLACRSREELLAAARVHRRVVIAGGAAGDVWRPAGDGEDPDEATARLSRAVDTLQALLDPAHHLPPMRVVLAVPDAPAYAPVVGLVRCLAREAPQLHVQRVLLCCADASSTPPPLTTILAQAAALHNYEELRVAANADAAGGVDVAAAQIVAQAAPAGELEEGASAPTPLAAGIAGRTVVVTGGTQGVGRALAAYCAARGAACVVVLARNLPAAPTTTAGPPTVFVKCDVADEDRVRAVVRWMHGGAAEDGLPPLPAPVGAFFHCAGVITDAVVAKIKGEPPALRRLLAAKVHAVSYMLSEAAAVRVADAGAPGFPMYMFSSSSAVLGPAGQGTYSAANAYIDAMAARYRAAGMPVTALQWGGWSLGMSERFDITPLAGEAFFDAAQGMRALEVCIASAAPAASVMLVSIPSWREYTAAVGLPPALLPSTLHAEAVAATAPDHPLLGCRVPPQADREWACHDTVWPAAWDARAMAAAGLLWIAGHQSDGDVIVPATLWLEMMALALQRELIAEGKRTAAATDPLTLNAVRFRAALELPKAAAKPRAGDAQRRIVRTAVDITTAPWRVQVRSRPADASGDDANVVWTVHADAVLGTYTTPVPQPAEAAAAPTTDVAPELEELYATMRRQGFRYEGVFRCAHGMRAVRGDAAGDDTAFVCIDVASLPTAVDAGDDEAAAAAQFVTSHSPAALDACTHVSSVLGNDGFPSRIEAFTVFPAAAGAEGASRVLTAAASADSNDRVNIAVKDAGGRDVAVFRGFETVSGAGEAPVLEQVVLEAAEGGAASTAGEVSPAGSSSSWVVAPRQTWVVVGAEVHASLRAGVAEALQGEDVHTVEAPQAAVDGVPGVDVVVGRLSGVVVLGAAGVAGPLRSVLGNLRVAWGAGCALVAVGSAADAAAAHDAATAAGLPAPPVCIAAPSGAFPPAAALAGAVQTLAARAAEQRCVAVADDGTLRTPALRAVAVPERTATEGDGNATAAAAGGPAVYTVDVTAAKGGYAAVVVPSAVPEPGADEVVVEVRTWALNFLDVFLASGVLSNARLGKVGGECCGRVVKVGAGCTGVAVGDVVAGLTASTSGLGSHAVLREHCCCVVPQALAASPNPASTVALAYGTAWLALKWLGRVSPGERVLIHAASGGVGQACVHLTKLFGGIPVCTVSSQAKRDFLTRHCGVDPRHIFNSRNALDFSAGVMDAFGGVDVVVNSLADEAMRASIRLLAPFGRFVELGKRDQQNHSTVDLNLFAMGQAYMSAHLDVLMKQPPQMRRLLREVWDAYADTGLPELSTVVYDIRDTAAAMELLNAGKHIGKVLLSCGAPSPTDDDTTAPLAAADATTAPPAAAAERELVQRLRVEFTSAPGERVDVRWVASPAALHELCTAGVPDAGGGRGVVVVAPAALAHPAAAALLQGLAEGIRHLRRRCAVVALGRGVDVRGVRADALALAARQVWEGSATPAGADQPLPCFVVAAPGDRPPLAFAPAPEVFADDGAKDAEVSYEDTLRTVVSYVASRMKLPEADVDVNASFVHLGLDSLAQLQLAHALRAEFGRSGITIHDKLTVAALVASLATTAAADDSDAAMAVSVVPRPAAAANTRRPLRLLCLHGFRSSKALMLSKLRPLVEAGDVELVLANAPHAARGQGDPNIPASERTYEWWWFEACLGYDEGFHLKHCEGLARSAAFLRELDASQGPFDGVVGFSQGAGMAHLAARLGIGRFLMLFSAVFSYDATPIEGAVRDAATVARLPSLHLYDPSESYGRHCAHALASFTSPARHEHSQGHDMTLTQGVLSAIATFLGAQAAAL